MKFIKLNHLHTTSIQTFISNNINTKKNTVEERTGHSIAISVTANGQKMLFIYK